MSFFNFIINLLVMLSILILNTEKLNSQVMLKINKLEENLWSFTLNNITKNTYRVFLESYLKGTEDKIISRKSSTEFQLHPGIVTITENDIGAIISKLNITPALSKCQFSVCVRQKFGPDLGFQNIEL